MIRPFHNKAPRIAKSATLMENTAVIGDVVLEEEVNVWYGAVIRGDENRIEIGAGSNVQDNATLHVAPDCPLTLGKNVTVGHNAVVHGCSVGDDTLIGMGAVILNGAVIGKGCIIAAGAVVKEREVIPDHSLCVGVPAKVIRTLDESAVEKNRNNAAMYRELAREQRP